MDIENGKSNDRSDFLLVLPIYLLKQTQNESWMVIIKLKGKSSEKEVKSSQV